MRSSFIYGYVNVNNRYSIDAPDAYKNTSRFSANFIWSPIARIDLGAEFLMGSRTNQNGETGKAGSTFSQVPLLKLGKRVNNLHTTGLQCV